MGNDKFNEAKDFILGLILLLIIFTAFIGTMWMQMSNPAFNEKDGTYVCSSSGVCK
jgi:hypothetical protein